MVIKKFYILLIIMMLSDVISAQMKQKDIEAIKSDTTLFYGLGRMCDSPDEALEDAKESLIKNIAKNCKPNAIFIAGNGDNQLENIIKTFNVRIDEKSSDKVVVEDDERNNYQYVVCLKRSDFRTMCNDRADDIRRYIARGLKAEDNVSMEDALKSYYWALMLDYAHPQGKKLRFKENNEVVDYEWLVNKINGNDGILKSFNFIIPKENGVEETADGLLVNLRVINTGGQDVVSLRCECHNGRKFMPNTVRDGKLVVQLQEKTAKSFKIKVNYDFKDDAKKMNIDVFNAIELVKVPRFSNNIYNIDLAKTMNYKKEEETPDWDKIEDNRTVANATYLDKMRRIENALREGNIAAARDCFSNEGYNMLDTLSHYGKMTVVGKPDYKFLKYKDEVLCRSITMQFDFKNTTGFSQDVVFRFDTVNRVVTSLAFRLSDQAENDIISKIKWSEEARLILVNFLEDYQTAYALKRHAYLESIYSDDALIIVGRMVKKTEIPDRMTFKLSSEEAQLKKYDKDTYMNNLRMCFGNNEYIRLRFTDTEFTRVITNDVYGVRVRQEYFSSSYGDAGYLFLLVDLRGKQPLIHVRAWQPDKVDLDKLMNIGDVRLN